MSFEGITADLSNVVDRECYKIKLKASGYRLVYEVIDNELIIIVVIIGKRNRNEVYDIAKNRL